MKPNSWNSVPRVFFRFAPIGKVEKRVLNSIWRYSSIRLFALLGKAHPKWWYETDLVEFDPKGFFSFRPDWESRKTRFELNLTIFVNSAFCAAWKSPPKMVVWNRPRGIRSQGCFFVSPRLGKSKNAFRTQLDDIRQFGFLRYLENPPKMVVWNRPRGIRSEGCLFVSRRWGKSKNAFWTQFGDIRQFGFLGYLEKPTQNGGMKATSRNSIPRVFFRFPPIGKVEKRVLNPIWRCSSIRLFALLGKAHPKWWFETDLVEFDPKGVYSFRLDGESRKTRFEPNLAIFVNSAFWATWKSPPKMVVWKRPRGIRSQGCFFVSPRLGKSKNAFWTQLDDIRQFGFLGYLENPPKMVVWNRPRGIPSQGCFFVLPRLARSKNAFWTQFDDVRQFGFLGYLEKPTQNGGMKPTSRNSIPTVFFRFFPIGKVEKRVLNSIWRYSSIRLFALLGKAHPKWWYETDHVEFDAKGIFSFLPDSESRKTRFELYFTIFVNSAFCATWKSPPKMVVWNRPRGIRSQGCLFVSPRLGRSKNAFWTQFDDIRQFGFLRYLEKPTQNGGMKATWWNSIPRVFFRFALIGKVEKRVLNSNWRYSSIRLFALLGKAHPKWWYESDLVEFDPEGLYSFSPDLESRKTRFERNLTIFVNSAFCATRKSLPKMVVWNRTRGIRFQGCFFVSPRLGKSKNAFWTQFDDIRQFGFLRYLEKPTQNGGMKPTSWNSIPRVFIRFAPIGKVQKRVLNAIWRYSSIRLFPLLGKAHPKLWYQTVLVEIDSKGVFSFLPDWEGRKRVWNAI